MGITFSPDIPCYLFRRLSSDHRMLDAYLEGRYPEVHEIIQGLFLLERGNDYRKPDHFFRNLQSSAINGEESLSDILVKAFSELSEALLETVGQQIHVQRGRFYLWQDLISRMPALVVMCQKIVTVLPISFNSSEQRYRLIQQWIRPNFSTSIYPCPRYPKLDDICREEGLRDLHLHLNGTTEADRVWLESLKSPEAWLRQSIEEFEKNNKVKEFYEQISPNLTPMCIYNRLLLAGWLRQKMVDEVMGNLTDDDECVMPQKELVIKTMNLHHKHPMGEMMDGANIESDIETEALFLVLVLRALTVTPSQRLSIRFHAYLLIWSQFQTLLVQNPEQCGFEQFNKVAGNESRGASEKEYALRFRQLSGKSGQELAVAEGRFSPKKTVQHNLNILDKILQGYSRLHGKRKNFILFGDESPWDSSQQRMKLRLIVHFIKIPDDPKKQGLKVRHHALRKDLVEKGSALLTALDHSKHARKLVTGIDAAANELHAPPEVFAPLYRRFRRYGFKNFTFHVGEDFHHLLSGLRAVWEALEFLELEAGNRIGHGTALGIDPVLWKERIGPCIALPKGEWLDNLVFAYDFIANRLEHHHGKLEKLRFEIEKYAKDLYKKSVPVSDLITAWNMRSLDPLIGFYPSSRKVDCLDLKAHCEWDRVEEQKKGSSEAWALFEIYHEASFSLRASDFTIVETDMLLNTGILREFQNEVMAKMNQREVVIECMPTSNLRISFYETYKEHHLWRWLGVEGQIQPEDVKPSVCIGSDDPGIFGTSIRNEFAHVHETLIYQLGVSPDKAGNIIAQLVNNAKVYTFMDGRNNSSDLY